MNMKKKRPCPFRMILSLCKSQIDSLTLERSTYIPEKTRVSYLYFVLFISFFVKFPHCFSKLEEEQYAGK